MPIVRVRSVQQKIFLLVLIANFFALIAAGVSFFYYDLKQHKDATAAALTTLAGIIGQGSAVALEFDDPKVANENLALLSANPNIRAAGIYSASGELFASYGKLSAEVKPRARLEQKGFEFAQGKLMISRPISSQDRLVGRVYLEQTFTLTTWLKDYLIILAIILVVSLALGLAVSNYLQRGISRPIQAISAIARQVMARREFHLRASKITEDETGQLADAFNGMLETLEHEIAVRSIAEKEVRTLNAQLEERVAERTAELRIANRDLVARTGEAEAANRAKADFLANMSHEIRTPMNAILGLAYLLSKSQLDANSADLAKKICNAGRSLQSIINDILDFSKIEAGKLEIETAPFVLNEVLDNLSSIMAANLGNKNIELIITPPPLLHGHLLGDALRLEQVLINLTSNAIKFTDAGSVIIDIQLLAQTQNEVKLRFSVKDSGIGIPKEKQAQIFAPFTQADLSTTRRFGGTGLGLTICKNIIAMMDGEIGLISEKGKGSEFWFTLTLSYVSFAEQDASENSSLNILIIDANDMSSENLALIVQTLGWHASIAHSQEEALEKVNKALNQKYAYDVLLVDWKMPESDGLSFIETLLDQWDPPALPVVLMMSTLSADEMSIWNSHPLVHGTLKKPVTSSSLYNSICEVTQPKGLDLTKSPSASTIETGKRIAGIRVLVVDDSEINREVALRILMSEGASVHLVDEGKAAVEWVEKNHEAIDVILMDVQMPIMDGYEATRQIRGLSCGSDLPIVALTAGVFKEEITAAKEAGMNAFVPKPFNVDQLLTTISNLANKTINSVEPLTTIVPTASIPANSFPGIAIEQAMELWGDAEDYAQYLLKFAREYADVCKRFENYYAAGDVSAAKTLAHKLKGVAGNLGLVDVVAAASALEKPSQDEPYDALNNLKIALDTTLTSIDVFAVQTLKQSSKLG